MSASVDELIGRMSAVEARLAKHAAAPVPDALTDPDEGATERWEAGQVWAHLAEFPSYWMSQIRGILAKRDSHVPEPIPFGRLRTDPNRVGAIERDRHEAPSALLQRVSESIAWAADELRAMPDAAWEARGLHSTLGEMDLRRIAERFIVAHLEEHADQLDLLASRSRSS